LVVLVQLVKGTWFLQA